MLTLAFSITFPTATSSHRYPALQQLWIYDMNEDEGAKASPKHKTIIIQSARIQSVGHLVEPGGCQRWVIVLLHTRNIFLFYLVSESYIQYNDSIFYNMYTLSQLHIYHIWCLFYLIPNTIWVCTAIATCVLSWLELVSSTKGNKHMYRSRKI